MRTVSSFLRLVIGFLWIGLTTVFMLPLLVLLLPWRIARIKVCNVWGHVVGRSITFLAGATPVIANRERLDGSMPAIYVMNHASTLDGFIGIWMCPIGGCGVFKKEIVRVPFYGWIAWLSGHLLLDRGNKERAVDALKDQAALMKQHRLGVWIMPEGTRSRDGRLLPFKKGFVHLALATGFPVVPVVVHEAHKNWESHTFRFVPMTIDVDVLPPIDTSAWKEETAAEHAQFVHDLMAKQLRESQKPVPVTPAAVAA